MHVRGVPDEWHKAIRHECVETGESLSDFAIKAFQREMKARGKPLPEVADEAER